MKHLGDITKIKNAPFVDCITFGSPCQNLSIAGKREGLAGEQSGLFIEAVRIIKEMREQSGGLYPTFAVWENVPGAFSSNSGEDFRTVLEELAHIKESEISIPRPENGKWAKAGFICGNGWSIAWRTFDAQLWGVPQRRRRIAVVMDFGGQRAGEILFERTGVSGNPEPSIPPWKCIARNPAHCAAGYDRMVGGKEPLTYPGVGITSKQNASNPKPGDPCHTLNTDSRNYVCVPINDKATRWMGGGKSRNHDGSGNGLGVGDETDPMFTLTAGDRHAVCCIGVDGYNGCETGDKSITIRARKSDQDHVGRVAIPINTQIATRHISLGERTGMGWGEDGDPAYTLQAGHEHAVCCLLNDQGGQSINVEDGVVSPTLRAESHAHEPIICAAFTSGQGAKAGGVGYAEELAPTLRGSGGFTSMPTVLCRAQADTNAETYENLSPCLATCHDGPPIVFDARGNGGGKICPTLTGDHENRVTDYTAVVAEPTVLESNQVHATITNTGVCPTLSASMGMGGGYVPMITRKISFSSSGFGAYNESIGTLRASGGDNGGGSENIIAEKRLRWIVRRLTPTECERLQGFPDGWTDIGEWYDSNGKKRKPADSPRYKALGNSIALPQWWWLTCKMAKLLPEHATLGSLFDGIGGFPLVWETYHGKGTARWASEIEEFPIAVTKKHFGDGKDG